MKAPDKVRIGLIPSENGGMVYTTVSEYFPSSDEYIRKDALLEWINEHRALHSGVTWNTLIDRINSL